MDLFPTAEQELLVATARDFAARTVTSERVRALEASEAGYDTEQWPAMADLGPLELALVAECVGRAAVPSPLVFTGALRNALPDVAAELPADAVVTLASLVPGARDEWSGLHPAGGTALTATYLLVPYAGAA